MENSNEVRQLSKAFSKLKEIYYYNEVIRHSYFKKKYKILNNNKISILIPTYNRSKLLFERALPSIIDQTYQNYEIIIIGDCCTDNTFKKLSELKNDKIKFFNLPSRKKNYPDQPFYHWLAGPVNALNKALTFVTGDWIARIDDDDIWTKNHLEILLNFSIKGDYDFVSSDYIYYENGVKKINSQKDSHPAIGGTQTWIYKSYLKYITYNKDCWKKSINRVNDLDLQDRIFKAGAKIGYLDKVTCEILPRPGDNFIGSKALKERSLYYKEFFKTK